MIIRLLSAIVLNLLHKITSQEIYMMFYGYLVWSLNHNITKDTYLLRSIPFLLAQSGILCYRRCLFVSNWKTKKKDSQGQKLLTSNSPVVSWKSPCFKEELTGKWKLKSSTVIIQYMKMYKAIWAAKVLLAR